MQAISRSPGKSGEVISARSWTSNRVSCRSPPRTSALTCGARSAVIQPRPAGATSSRSRAAVSMPRSPTSTTVVIPNRSLTLATWAATVVGVPGVAREHLDRDRDALGGGQQPVDDLQPAPHPVLGVPDRAQRAGPPLERGRGDVIQHQGAAGQVPGGQRVLDRAPAGHAGSPSPRTGHPHRRTARRRGPRPASWPRWRPAARGRWPAWSPARSPARPPSRSPGPAAGTAPGR